MNSNRRHHNRRIRGSVLAFALFVAVPSLVAQDSIRLDQCHVRALLRAPRARDKAHLTEMSGLKRENAETLWYPSLTLNGKATYQSDVVELALEGGTLPFAIPDLPHDQYGLNLDLRQTLYDGGMVSSQKGYQEALLAADLQKVDVDLYGLHEQVDRIYFGLLLLQENQRNLDSHREVLESRRDMVATAVKEGAMLASELHVIDVELLKMRKMQFELNAGRDTYLESLQILCDTVFDQPPRLALPVSLGTTEAGPEGSPSNRPEYAWFQLQDASLEAGKELMAKKRMPVVFAYGQTGYGKPGYNMLGGVWDFYYLVGAGVSWELWDWRSNQRERSQIEQQQHMLHNQEASFDRQVRTEIVREQVRIGQLMENLAVDGDMVALQEQITASALVQWKEGAFPPRSTLSN
ncbi:MAG: TolC family protein [Bacteroidales bacterium]